MYRVRDCEAKLLLCLGEWKTVDLVLILGLNAGNFVLGFRLHGDQSSVHALDYVAT